jgi:Abnormal spindle-like microcephaly-assoc'd, ASPM-SPD-2-Hydin
VIARILLFASLLPLSALAQLQVFQFDGTNYAPVGPIFDVGTVAPGDTLETRFRLRNTSSAPIVLQTLSLAGEGFSIQSAPSLPYTLAPYAGPASEAEIDTDFSPTFAASYSASLAINNVNIVLEGAAVPSAVVTLAGSNTPLSAGATVGFGSVPVGSTQTQGFVLTNPGSAAIDVGTLTVAGAGFKGPIGLSAPVQLGPGQSASFQVSFSPQTGTAAQGVLTVDSRTFNLTGQGLNPPLPSATIIFASTVGGSAQQNSVSISLASASKVSGTGTLTMTFQPTVEGVSDDAAVEFLAGPARQATVTISPGDTSAQIGGQSTLAFQTGTTAGTITFTLTLENNAPVQATLTIPPSMIVLDSFTAVRELGSLQVAFSGFDNTYSASELAFTFYDLKGIALPQGAINVDAATAFQQYFTTTQAGGSFALLATFPVTGDTSQIGFVSAQITNSAGATTEQQIPFVN